MPTYPPSARLEATASPAIVSAPVPCGRTGHALGTALVDIQPPNNDPPDSRSLPSVSLRLVNRSPAAPSPRQARSFFTVNHGAKLRFTASGMAQLPESDLRRVDRHQDHASRPILPPCPQHEIVDADPGGETPDPHARIACRRSAKACNAGTEPASISASHAGQARSLMLSARCRTSSKLSKIGSTS